MALVKPPRPPAGKVYLGLWSKPGRPGYSSGSDIAGEFAKVESQMGRKADIGHYYFTAGGWANSWNNATTKMMISNGRIPMINYKSPAGTSWTAIRNGVAAIDAVIDQHAQECITIGVPMFAAYFGEGDAGGPGGTMDDFGAAHARIIQRFKAAGATNVAHVLNLTSPAFTNGKATACDPANHGQPADWIGPDGYNYFGRGGDAWRTFEQVATGPVNWANANHPGTPIAYLETGTMEDPADAARKGAWYATVVAALKKTGGGWPDLDAICFFNSYPPGDGAFVPNWYPDSQPKEDNSQGWGVAHPNWPTGWHYGPGASLTGYVSAVNDPVFGGGGGGGGGGTIPQLTTPPTMTPAGTTNPTAGATLTSGTGVWTNSPTSYSYQWDKRLGTAAWVTIVGATSNTYVTTSADVGYQFRSQVTAHNAAGDSAPKQSDFSGIVQAATTPVNTVLPSVSDSSPSVTELLQASPGVWSGSQPITYTYQWQKLAAGTPGTLYTDNFNRSVSAGGWGTASGGTSYVVLSGTAANYSVNGTRGVIQLPTASAQFQAVKAGVSTLIQNPDTTATLRFTAVSTGPAGGGNGHAAGVAGRVVDANNMFYADVIQFTDGSVNVRIRKRVGAATTNLASVAATNVTSITANTDYKLRFQINGTQLQAKVWLASASEPGTWDVPPVTESVDLQMPGDVGLVAQQNTTSTTSTAQVQYDAATTTSATGGGTSDWVNAAGTGNATQNYTVASGDLGLQLRVLVTATNSLGNQTSPSSATSAVAAAPTTPVNTALPVLSWAGNAQAGTLLSVTNGSWSNSPTSFAYKWQRQDPASGSWVDLAGQTANTYTASSGDVGGAVRAQVRATNGSGNSSYVASNATPPIAALGTLGITITDPQEGDNVFRDVHVTASVLSTEGGQTGVGVVHFRVDTGAWVDGVLTDAAGGVYEADVHIDGQAGEHIILGEVLPA